ncbi:zinc finger protein 480 isoform X2 [Anabrus simplex]|uniref:zinc finger protein 480 isoform X2 n=1 Tax=Anabrus simplex TaxID=316456 RepID=UPI0035A38B13
MEVIPVFDWAHVKVASEFLEAMNYDKGRSKHDVLQHLALTGGVAMEWEGEGDITLKGTWSCMLQAQVSNSVPERDQPVSNIKNFEKCRLESEVNGSTSKAKSQSEEGNEVYVNITLSSLPFPVVATDGKSSISQDLILPHEKGSTRKSEKRLHIQDDSVVNYCIPELSEKCKPDPNGEISSNNNREGINSQCVQLKSVNASEKDCIVSEHSTENHQTDSDSEKNKDIMIKIKQVAQFLKLPDGMQVKTKEGDKVKLSDRRSEVSCARENKPSLIAEAVPESDHVAKDVSLTSSTSDCAVKKDFEAETSSENKNVEPVKSTVTKKKIYEELSPFKFFCTICSFKSKRESHYQRHLQLHNQVSKLYACDKCNFKAIRLGHLRRHELSHSSTTVACNLCHYRTNNHKALAKHKRIKHKTNQITEGKKEIFQCKHCEYSTSKNHFLLRHQRVHGLGSTVKIQKSYQCDQCQYKTSRREHLVRHSNNIHGGQRPFLCHHCGKAFKRQDALKQHATTHVSEATVICPVCSKGCRSQAHLTQHMAVHSTVRSYLCELCGSAFKTRAVQRKHILTIHQHPKAFFCHHCSRKFNTKYALRRHNKQHSSERKSKPEDQAPRPVTSAPGTVPDALGTSMKMLQADAIFIQDTPRNHFSDNPSSITMQENPGQHDGEKITVQLAENYDPETLRVILSHMYVHHSNETATALLYLTGNFTPY